MSNSFYSFSSLKLCHGNLFLRKREHTNTPTGHKCLMLEIIQPNFYELLTIIHMYRVILISIFVPDTYYALLQLYFSVKIIKDKTQITWVLKIEYFKSSVRLSQNLQPASSRMRVQHKWHVGHRQQPNTHYEQKPLSLPNPICIFWQTIHTFVGVFLWTHVTRNQMSIQKGLL